MKLALPVAPQAGSVLTKLLIVAVWLLIFTVNGPVALDAHHVPALCFLFLRRTIDDPPHEIIENDGEDDDDRITHPAPGIEHEAEQEQHVILKTFPGTPAQEQDQR